METIRSQFERIRFTSSKSFDEVIARLYEGIGRPDMAAFGRSLAASESPSEYERIVNQAAGKADLIEFLRLDLGAAIGNRQRMLRIIAGNPLIMREMARRVPDAGSYAPVTILVYEHEGKVQVRYDRMASYLAGYGNDDALRVAEDLDDKVIGLIQRATES